VEEVGEVEEEEILDKDGNSTGKFRRKATGKGGLKGYTVAGRIGVRCPRGARASQPPLSRRETCMRHIDRARTRISQR
jgi:hypothetical protein